MKITLRGEPFINKNNPAFIESVEGEMVDAETRRLTQKYNISIYELILIDARPLYSFRVNTKTKSENEARRLLLFKSILRGKRIYFIRLFLSNDCLEFSLPEQVTFEIEKPDCKSLRKLNNRFGKKQKTASLKKEHIKKIAGYLAEINKETLKGLISCAKRDFDFIFHFNSEMFHHNISTKGLSFTKENVTGIYEQEKYTKILDLSDARERMGFISLYAITFYGLELDDLYSVDGIFALQPNRENDEKKRMAGREVFELVFGEECEEIQARVLKMATALKNLPLPEISVNITSAVKKNYTLYCGIGDIGRAFSRLVLSDDESIADAIKIAQRVSFYKKLEKYYDELSTGAISPDFEKSEIYKGVMNLANAAQGKKTAGELVFSIK
ncbi:MAG: hypothetical protein FWG70_00850 [Oscillospiraceae bacterium]|nr:hypothetical protein [Oscillospiraceae bacterium]